MTSLAMQSRRAAARDALNNCAGQLPKASVVRDALLRGVSEETIIETIERSQKP